MGLARGGALTGVEGDQEDVATHSLHELPGGYDSQVAIVLLEAQDGSPLFISSTVPHKMHDTLALARHEMTQLLDARRASPLQSDTLGDFLDDVFQAHPYAIYIERLYVMTERIGRNRDDMQVDIFQCRRRSA